MNNIKYEEEREEVSQQGIQCLREKVKEILLMELQRSSTDSDRVDNHGAVLLIPRKS